MWKANEFFPTGKLEAFVNLRQAKWDDLLNLCTLSKGLPRKLVGYRAWGCVHKSQQSYLDLPLSEVKWTFWGSAVWVSHFVLGFRSGVVDASLPPSFSHFSFQRVGLQIDGEQFPTPGNCMRIFTIFRKSELRAVLSFWIFEISSLISCLLS